MKILFLTNIPSPNRVDFFNELGKYCELTVGYERGTAADRDGKWTAKAAVNFKEVYLNLRPFKTDLSIGNGLVKLIQSETFDVLVFTVYVSPATMKAISYVKRKKIPYVMEYDGGYNKKDGFFYKKLKKYLLGGAFAHLTTQEHHKKYLTSFGIKEENIYKYPLSSVFEKDVIEKPDYTQKTGKKALTVTRFIEGKGIPTLLRAAAKADAGIHLDIVGGEATEEFVRLRDELGLNEKVTFVPFKTGEELKKYFREADFMVFPTEGDVWGLVVNEAMAAGLPVVTTDMCGAATEMVEEGENGFVVKSGDFEALTEKIDFLAKDKEARERMSLKALETAKNFTIERMAQKNMEIFNIIAEKH